MTRVCNSHGGDQPVAGLPRLRPAGGAAGGRRAGGARRARTSTPSPGARRTSARPWPPSSSRFMGLPIDPDAHVVVTCGSTEAMMAAMMTACNPGDQVIVFSPFYENYVADTILSGAEPIYVPLRPPDFRFDPDELRRAFEQRPKALILCNPSNPTGKVFTREELRVHRRPGGGVRRLRHHRRGLRAHRLRAAPAHLLRHAAGHVRAHDLLQFALQDLLHHRLAPGLRDRARRRSSTACARCTTS